MKTIKVAEATELQIDWLVARIEGVVGDDGLPKLFRWTGSGRLSVRSEPRSDSGLYDPSTNWARGGAGQSKNAKGFPQTGIAAHGTQAAIRRRATSPPRRNWSQLCGRMSTASWAIPPKCRRSC